MNNSLMKLWLDKQKERVDSTITWKPQTKVEACNADLENETGDVLSFRMIWFRLLLIMTQ